MKKLNRSNIRNLILNFIKDDKTNSFRNTFKNLDEEEVIEFEDIILTNILSANFFSFIDKNNLSGLMSEKFLRQINYQIKRFQVHGLAIIKEISVINEIFTREGLHPIYLKGVALQNEYDDIVLRPLVDIDVLFHKDDLLKAYKALHINNVLHMSEENYLNADNFDYFCKFSHHISVKTKNDISIELHHRITKTRQFATCPITDAMFKNFREINYFGQKISIPSIENVIVHQLVHFSLAHDFNRLLRTIYDIKEINIAYKINWLEIILKFDDLRIRKSICASLKVIDKYGVPIQNLNKIELSLREYFPGKKISKLIEDALLDTGRKADGARLLSHLKLSNFFNTACLLLFPRKGQLICKFKISKISFYNLSKAYIKNLIFQFSKFKYLFSIIKMILKSSGNREIINPIAVWMNKSQ